MQNYNLICYGTRGSGQLSDNRYMKYGGNTSCFCVDTDNEYIVFDAGSGLADLGRQVLGDMKPVHIFIGHYHLDHIIGLPYCQLFFEENREIHIYGPSVGGMDIKEVLSQFVRNPFWPVDIFNNKADVHFHSLEREGIIIFSEGRASVSAKGISEKADRYENIYTLTLDNKKLIYALDYEITEDSRDYYKKIVDCADVLIQDAGILPEEKNLYIGWGHSDWNTAMEIAEEAKVKQVILTHYGLKHTDDILQMEEQRLGEKMTKKSEDKISRVTKIVFAKQGEKYSL